MRERSDASVKENASINLIDLLSSKVDDVSPEVKKYIISLAKKGKLSQHQTSGQIEEWTDEILRRLREGRETR